MHRRLLCSALLASAVLVACDQAETPSMPVGDLPVASARENNPGNGALVYRTELNDWFFYLVPDFRKGITAVVGITPTVSEICATDVFELSTYEAKHVLRPSGEIAEVLRASDLPVYVYDVGSADFCGELAEANLIATGTVRFHSTDRDTDSFTSNPPSYGYSIIGTVTLTSGGTARIAGHVKWTERGDREPTVQSNLTLAPTGMR